MALQFEIQLSPHKELNKIIKKTINFLMLLFEKELLIEQMIEILTK